MNHNNELLKNDIIINKNIIEKEKVYKKKEIKKESNDLYTSTTQSSDVAYELCSLMIETSKNANKPICLDDFSLIRVIGKGSFGKVTLVRKKDNSKIFAMKVLSKPNIILRKQVEHTKTERRVLAVTSHPFIVSLHYAFQTKDKLYFIMDYCPGGELFFHLSRLGKFPEKMAKFYLAELVVALEHLHSLGVVYRDLKPENILVDEMGHIKLADFGLAKDNVTNSTSGALSLCGTPEYLAPEILNQTGHGTAVDWWGLGMVFYEMLTGLPPWYTRNREELFKRIKEATLQFPEYVSDPARSLISLLLHREPSKRLGSKYGANEVKNHLFFKDTDWDGLLWSEPPYKPCDPVNKDQIDTSNFEKEFTELPLDENTPCDNFLNIEKDKINDLINNETTHNEATSIETVKSIFNGFTFEAPCETMPTSIDAEVSLINAGTQGYI